MINVGSDHVFGFVRMQGEMRVVVLVNFTETEQHIPANEVRLYGLGYHFTELISGQQLTLGTEPIHLDPYQVLWLQQ